MIIINIFRLEQQQQQQNKKRARTFQKVTETNTKRTLVEKF
jgi:hypothetical protein